MFSIKLGSRDQQGRPYLSTRHKRLVSLEFLSTVWVGPVVSLSVRTCAPEIPLALSPLIRTSSVLSLGLRSPRVRSWTSRKSLLLPEDLRVQRCRSSPGIYKRLIFTWLGSLWLGQVQSGCLRRHSRVTLQSPTLTHLSIYLWSSTDRTPCVRWDLPLNLDLNTPLPWILTWTRELGREDLKREGIFYPLRARRVIREPPKYFVCSFFCYNCMNHLVFYVGLN